MERNDYKEYHVRKTHLVSGPLNRFGVLLGHKHPSYVVRVVGKGKSAQVCRSPKSVAMHIGRDMGGQRSVYIIFSGMDKCEENAILVGATKHR